MQHSRREFIKNTTIGAAGITIGGIGLSAKSYGRIIGSNERMNFAVLGINSRGKAHISAINACENTAVSYLCDVDSIALETALGFAEKKSGIRPKGMKDIRKLLEIKDIDAITIATPEQWHTPMAIMGVQAGKHVYVEKPCSHDLNETMLLLKAWKKYGKVIQMGNQQRSGPTTIEGVKRIRQGVIGKPYHGRAWYANSRGSIGKGKVVPVPDNLDWELWQGPAPREKYRDNVVHYNWHWFKTWGTGEALNNSTHEIDICRYALGVDLPYEIQSTGGRYHFDDDWEFFDTQNINYKYDNDVIMTWEGKSCNGLKVMNRGRGSLIYGSEGSMMLDRNGYILYDRKGKEIEQVKEKEASATINTVGAGRLDTYHFQNFIDGIRKNTKLNSRIDIGAISVDLGHLANISQFTGETLKLDPRTGRILNSKKALNMLGRDYEPGWEPKV